LLHETRADDGGRATAAGNIGSEASMKAVVFHGIGDIRSKKPR
jgi:hypothetical protein